jgi:1,2-diacylglycerol 3-beta-glucosyltransferase
MSVVAYVCIGYATLYISYQLILLIRIVYYYTFKSVYPFSDNPTISILIAARNEEASILSCLKAIERLHYPADKIDVWIGDDQSTDATNSLITTFIQHKPNFHLVSIQPSKSHVKGKANVLAQLAKFATGELFFITDADIHVPPTWIESLLFGFKNRVGIVSGSTIVDGSGLLAKIQRIDWAYASGMIHVVSEMNIPVTAIGNNMAIRRTCYEDTGGYENLSFSVTEDLELFLASLKKGWGFKNLLNAGSTARSAPLHTIKEILQQRKRWLSGAMRLPKTLLIFLIIQAVYFPVLVLAFMYFPFIWVFLFWLTIFGLHAAFISEVSKKMNIPNIRKSILLFELNRYFFPMLLSAYYFFPTGVKWKGRTYTGRDVQPK